MVAVDHPWWPVDPQLHLKAQFGFIEYLIGFVQACNLEDMHQCYRMIGMIGMTYFVEYKMISDFFHHC